MENAKKVLGDIVGAIADGEFSIKETTDEMGVLLTLSVAKEGMGKIIGRDGNTAKAIRTILRVVGKRENARINLKINEPEGSSYAPKEKEQL